jgi:hypothetical protein
VTDNGFAEMVALIEGAYRLAFNPKQLRAWRVLCVDVEDPTGRRAAIMMCKATDDRPTCAHFMRCVAEIREQRHEGSAVGSPPSLPAPATRSHAAIYWRAVCAEIEAMPQKLFPSLAPRMAGDLKVAQAMDTVTSSLRERGKLTEAQIHEAMAVDDVGEARP